MEFDEISFVPGGANQKAHIAMWKSEQRVPIWKMDYGKRLGTGLAELRRQEAIAKADVEDGPVAFDPVTPSISLIRAGYAQVVAKSLELDHSSYDDRYRWQGDPQAWATPHEGPRWSGQCRRSIT